LLLLQEGLPDFLSSRPASISARGFRVFAFEAYS
jgi:hypothetical protein